MQPNKDGKLIYLSKEIQAKEVEGELIGENLLASISALGNREKRSIVLLNDTATTLLAGKSAANKTFDSYIGFILGTGANSAYIESNRNIAKETDLDPTKSQIITLKTLPSSEPPSRG